MATDSRPLILASSSRYRRALLERLGIPFITANPDVDEAPLPGEAPSDLVRRLAIAKATRVAGQYPSGLVIGSDQVAVYDGITVGKPGHHPAAVAQLRRISGKTAVLYTGLAVLDAASGRLQTEVVPFRITFRALTDAQIEAYLAREQPYDCAGSVRSEGLGIALLERFEGEDPNALIGLPLIRLVRMLEAESFPVL